jgi:hypothetical protein
MTAKKPLADGGRWTGWSGAYLRRLYPPDVRQVRRRGPPRKPPEAQEGYLPQMSEKIADTYTVSLCSLCLKPYSGHTLQELTRVAP